MVGVDHLKVVSVKTTETKAGRRLSVCVIIRIGLSDGALFSFNPIYLPRPFQGGGYFFPGRELGSEEVRALHFAADCFRAERAGLRLAARAEQSRTKLGWKLEQRGHGAACVKAAVAYLVEMEIVDDRRFAGRWIQSRLYRGTDSPLRLINGLCRRGIDRDIAKEASALDFERETELLRKFVAKRYPGADPRILRGQLKREGFSSRALEWYLEEEQPENKDR
jgi:regulatory protein